MRTFRLASILCLMFFGACSFPAWKGQYHKGTVVVMPPRDVVQGGKPHEEGAGSGKLFGDTVASRLERAGWSVRRDVDSRFGNDKLAATEEALAEARRLTADYVLLIALGEFRDAAAMTFRSDYATIESAVMLATANGEPVWRMEHPVTSEKTNLGSYRSLVEGLAVDLAASVASAPQ